MGTTQTWPRYAVARSYAGHCSFGGSDKDYAICLAQALPDGEEDGGADLPWKVLFVYGKPGSLRRGDAGAHPSRAAAEMVYNQKVKEKATTHHYTPLPGLDFAPFVRHFARLYQVSLELPGAEHNPEAADGANPDQAGAVVGEQPAVADPRYAGCSVTDITLERFWQCAETPRFGTQEKVDGERCTLAGAQQRLTAYNRSGVALSDVPDAAQALLRLGDLAFLVDGERMVNTEQSGHYILFDLLEWQGEDIRAWPYGRRNETLQQALFAAGLIKEIRPTPTQNQAYENSTVPGLALLTPVVGRESVQQCVRTIEEDKGEGMVVRDLTAAYHVPRSALKYKFTADIDAVVVGINPGTGGGSLELGLRRPADNAVIAIGRVRAGLSKEDMRRFAEQFAQGNPLVITVKYRLKRTIGITLVEPAANPRARSDKSPWQCTTDQFGPEKAPLIKEAPALRGISFEEDPRSAPSDQEPAQTSLW